MKRRTVFIVLIAVLLVTCISCIACAEEKTFRITKDRDNSYVYLYGNHLVVEYYTGNDDEVAYALIDKDGKIEYTMTKDEFDKGVGLVMFTDSAYVLYDSSDRKLTWYDYDDNIIAEHECDGIVGVHKKSDKYYGLNQILCFETEASIDANTIKYIAYNGTGEVTGSVEYDYADCYKMRYGSYSAWQGNEIYYDSTHGLVCYHTGHGNLYLEIQNGKELDSVEFFSNSDNKRWKSRMNPADSFASAGSSENVVAIFIKVGDKNVLTVADIKKEIDGTVDEKYSSPRILAMNDDYILVYFRNDILNSMLGSNDYSGYYLYKLDKEDLKNTEVIRYEGKYFDNTSDSVLRSLDYLETSTVYGRILNNDDIIVSVLGKDKNLYFIHLDRNLQDIGSPVMAKELTNKEYTSYSYGKDLFAMNAEHYSDENCIVYDYYGNVVYEGKGQASTLGDFFVLRTGEDDTAEIVYFDNNKVNVIDKIYMS